MACLWSTAPPIRYSYPRPDSSFLPTAKAAIQQLSEARQTIRDADRGDSQFVRFSVLHTISVNYLASRIESLQDQLPDLRTRVISDSLSTVASF